ncbi:MAG: ABC transporter substrate-binding protein [Anaerolineae bacterium]|nr:ABC transporter substrate-binding protein [Anaerolineae bacterium]
MQRLNLMLQAALVLALVIMPVMQVAAQDGDPADQNGDPAGFPRDVIDASGAVVTIPARPPIVASAGPVPALEAVFPAARIRWIDPVHAADPLQAAGTDWREVGLLVVPDLVAAAYPALITAAEAARVPVFRVGLIDSLDDWRATIEALGYATGQDNRAAGVIAQLDDRLALVQVVIADRDPVRVLVLTPEGYTFGQGTLFTDIVTAAGGINAAAEAGFADFRQVDDHTIRDLAPDVIILSPAWTADMAAAFVANPAYARVPAVQAGRVYRLPVSLTQPADPGWALLAVALVLHGIPAGL